MSQLQAQNGVNPAQQALAEMKVVEYVPFGAKTSIKLTMPIVRDIVAVKTKKGVPPTDQQIMKFMLLCKARMLNPFEGDAFLIGFDSGKEGDPPTFQLITAHQAFLKRAEVHPEYDGMESGVIVKLGADEFVTKNGYEVTIRSGSIFEREGDFFLETDTLLGGWATVFFKGRSHPMRKRLRLATFNKGYGRWKDDPAGQIVKCSEADSLRSSFPTTLGALYLEEEIPQEQTFTKVESREDQRPSGRRTLRSTAPEKADPIISRPVPEDREEPQQPSKQETPAEYIPGVDEPLPSDPAPAEQKPAAAQQAMATDDILGKIEIAIVNAGKVAKTVCGEYGVRSLNKLTMEQAKKLLGDLTKKPAKAAAPAQQEELDMSGGPGDE